MLVAVLQIFHTAMVGSGSGDDLDGDPDQAGNFNRDPNPVPVTGFNHGKDPGVGGGRGL